MPRVKTESITWGMDEGGYFLKIRTSLARQIVGSVKAGIMYVVDIKRHRKRRSLDQNAMYWSILGQIAKALGISNSKAHNIMLRRYGVPERYGEQSVYVVLPDTEEAAEQADEAESYHVRPTSQVKAGKDGQSYRTYILLRGSSTYDTAEMTRLIDGAMDEAKQMGLTLLWEE